MNHQWRDLILQLVPASVLELVNATIEPVDVMGKFGRISPAPGGNLNPLAGISHEPRGAREGLLVLRGCVAGKKVAVAGVPQHLLPVFDEPGSNFK